MVRDVEVGRAADAEAALVADATGAASVSAHAGNDQPRSEYARGLIAAAEIAEKWRDENRASATEARKSHPELADQLNGAAIECHAIAGEIRRLARSA